MENRYCLLEINSYLKFNYVETLWTSNFVVLSTHHAMHYHISLCYPETLSFFSGIITARSCHCKPSFEIPPNATWELSWC